MINKAAKRRFVIALSNTIMISDNIKRMREAKGLSQKEVISAISMGAAQYSRIENGKTDPSISTVEKIAKALGVTMAELFTDANDLKEINSLNKTLIERVTLIDTLTKEEQKTIFTILDAFISKRKFKSTLKNVLKDIE
ncbi:helix-turn-helix domain-containing protein [Polaribacter cellanae]|uniref:Helix-turn-helix domain-containing protein n=1 Tax=Polaribacter cellanae TaxID=2818493 RepID=A0A975H558_9FLAO|nr:helix-turn-helix transcriptional regulator [Polaribacter cellanae]QTE21038.1 helix-turn-helix domain-containing protein [Polaribacter cellanae]QTE21047.1 helix-turn-helix domain-containing protein [Polaribacter cellanae]